MYQSTRGPARASLSEALLRGLAEDGGLFVPTERPTAVAVQAHLPADPTFLETALAYAPWMIPGLDEPSVDRVVRDAVTFDVPLRHLEQDLYVLELHHGPTHAFKDVGARFMAAMLQHLSGGNDGTLTVLVATSGDTGGAVASAFDGVPGVRVVVLFPQGGVSQAQRRQMSTRGPNVTAVSVRGTFDDCQRLVKGAFLDPDLRADVPLTSANSINVGRLLPQSLYYWHAAHRLKHFDDAAPTFVVPSGNLGNLCSGLFAMGAGMRCGGFLAACNANHGFIDLLRGGDFEPRPSRTTLSNAMDVGAPSNLERIRWFFGGDDDRLRQCVQGAWASDEETLATMRSVFDRTGYILDPHSAVAYGAAERHSGAEGPRIVLATAHPAKFAPIVHRALGREPDPAPGLVFPENVEERVVAMDAEPAELKGLLLGGVA